LAKPGSEAVPGPVWLRKLIGDEYFQEVVEVDWNGKQDLIPEELEWFSYFPRLDTVNLNFSNINDEGLAHLANLRRLKTVYLEEYDDVTDIGLSHLAGLRELEYLSLLATSCTDEGVRNCIPGFSKLTYLDLAGIPVTHDTAMELRKLKDLTFVHLGRVGHRAAHDLSDAVASIKQQLPNCKINYWGPGETSNVE
jgi:hypothetical protein